MGKIKLSLFCRIALRAFFPFKRHVVEFFHEFLVPVNLVEIVDINCL